MLENNDNLSDSDNGDDNDLLLIEDQWKNDNSIIKEKIIAAMLLENLTKIKVSLINSVIYSLENRFPVDVFSIITSFLAHDPLSLKNLSFAKSKKKYNTYVEHSSNNVDSEKLFKEYNDVYHLIENSYSFFILVKIF